MIWIKHGGGKLPSFLLPIAPHAPFGHASRVPSSVFDPNRDDWGRVSKIDVALHYELLSPSNETRETQK